jgi:hypothetical protein
MSKVKDEQKNNAKTKSTKSLPERCLSGRVKLRSNGVRNFD